MTNATGTKETTRFLTGTALIVCWLTLAGCSTGDAARSQGQSDILQSISFWQPHLLYILASPHSRLYVEVDAVKGCAPSDRALSKLRNFLTTYCNKPGGIEIVRSDVIPVAAAKGILPNPLARKYLNGPPDDPNAPPSAFLYVLYYSGALSDKHEGAEAGRGDKKTPPHPRQRNVHPHADLLPYPAILFMNTNYMTRWGRAEILLHEAGHLLGLAGRPTYASGYHCLGFTCLMNKRFLFSRFILGWQRRPCKRCVAQLAESSMQPPPANLRFVGPVLVRSENGYDVMSLPKRVRMVLGDLTEQNCRDFAAGVHDETPSPGGDNEEFLVDAHIDQAVLDDPAKMRDLIRRVKNDPYEAVRRAAAKIWPEAEAAGTD